MSAPTSSSQQAQVPVASNTSVTTNLLAQQQAQQAQLYLRQQQLQQQQIDAHHQQLAALQAKLQQPLQSSSHTISSGVLTTPSMSTSSASNSAATSTSNSASKSSSSATTSAGGRKPATEAVVPGPNKMILKEGPKSILPRARLRSLLTQIAPAGALDPDVEEILMEVADDFVENVTGFACSLAKHRRSDILEVRDLQLHLDRNWDIRLPGVQPLKPIGTQTMLEQHRQRLARVKQTTTDFNDDP
mmetsp:Transcript_39683/g.99927  ORF Transcript_39683/g.99927 Transcript_39683/m.99927 type:complete len:245 (+) Transcript_39683:19-753(+)